MMPRSLQNHGSCKWHASNDAQSGVPNGCRIKTDTNTPLQVGRDARCFHYHIVRHWEVKVIRGPLRTSIEMQESSLCMGNKGLSNKNRHDIRNPKLQGGKSGEISKDTVVPQQ